jgi:hypothetical protein
MPATLSLMPAYLYSLFISMDGVYAENRQERFQRISMDGVYAENRRERFQCTFHY